MKEMNYSRKHMENVIDLKTGSHSLRDGNNAWKISKLEKDFRIIEEEIEK
jgi:hypothetical protein